MRARVLFSRPHFSLTLARLQLHQIVGNYSTLVSIWCVLLLKHVKQSTVFWLVSTIISSSLFLALTASTSTPLGLP